MRNFLGGAVFGVLLGAALVYALIRSDTATEPSSAAVLEMSSAEYVRPDDSAAPAGMNQSIPSSTSKSGAEEAVSTSNATPPPTFAVQFSSSAPQTTPLPHSIVDPIKVSEAHRNVLSVDESFLDEHKQLEAQARDDSWSYYMEQLLRGYIASRPGLGVEIANIACRTTMCEIQAICVNGPGNLDNLLRQARKEPWWEFERVMGRAADDDVEPVAVVMFLERAKKKSEH